MNCFDLALKSASVKKFVFVLATHYTENESESIQTLELNSDYFNHNLTEYEVVMFSAMAKDTLRIWGYREV